jgi:hypothetical protein
MAPSRVLFEMILYNPIEVRYCRWPLWVHAS